LIHVCRSKVAGPHRYARTRAGASRVSPELVASALLFVVSIFVFDDWIGLSALHPSRLEWLYVGDCRRNLAAINLFRGASWQFPLGHIETSDFPVGANILFMDGNPLLANVTKLLGPFLGPVAQTYGAWTYLCALLQLWSVYWALRQLDVPSVYAFFGSLLIGLLPTFYYRVGHLDLLSHFVIIIGWGHASFSDDDVFRPIAYFSGANRLFDIHAFVFHAASRADCSAGTAARLQLSSRYGNAAVRLRVELASSSRSCCWQRSWQAISTIFAVTAAASASTP
jgi:hypothetical protein